MVDQGLVLFQLILSFWRKPCCKWWIIQCQIFSRLPAISQNILNDADVLLIHLACPKTSSNFPEPLKWCRCALNQPDLSHAIPYWYRHVSNHPDPAEIVHNRPTNVHQSTSIHKLSTFLPDYPPITSSYRQNNPKSSWNKHVNLSSGQAIQLRTSFDILWHSLTFKMSPRPSSNTQNLQILYPDHDLDPRTSIDIQNNPKPYQSNPEPPRP